MQARCISSVNSLANLARRECRVLGELCGQNREKSTWTRVASPPACQHQHHLHDHGFLAKPKAAPATTRCQPWLGLGLGCRHYCRVSQYLQQNFEASQLASVVRVQDHTEQGFSFQSFDDHLFEVLSDSEEKVSVSKFLQGLRNVGLWQKDHRLRECMQQLGRAQSVAMEMEGGREVLLDRETFKECIKDNIELIKRAFTGEFVIPEFPKFCSLIDHIYWHCRTNTKGQVATYIPQLSRYSADNWGVSLCTIDGQRHSIGDVKSPFSMQSCSKPLTYAFALNELGSKVIHQYVGHEPSGESFNRLKLNDHNKPHNPLINAGAIVVASLLKSNWKLADKFDYISNQYKRVAGGEYLGFNNAIFLSERETADRNFALGYYMKENKCFPDGINLHDVMDFYFQLCSIEITCESGAIMAATLANGGICPVTGEQIFNTAAVRDTLSLMHSCGMYDYSGQFAFQVGVPAKSGVSGGTLLVIPNVMGVCLWSPPLDNLGNSVRGLQFSEDLVKNFAFHNYDNFKRTTRKIDPRKRRTEARGEQIVELLFSAYHGDLTALRRMALAGIDMDQADYDGRTALHLAAAEGHLSAVRFLLEKSHVRCTPKDRWQRTPYDDAIHFTHSGVAQFLKEWEEKVSFRDDASKEDAAQNSSEATAE